MQSRLEFLGEKRKKTCEEDMGNCSGKGQEREQEYFMIIDENKTYSSVIKNDESKTVFSSCRFQELYIECDNSNKKPNVVPLKEFLSRQTSLINLTKIFLGEKQLNIPKAILERLVHILRNQSISEELDSSRFVYYLLSGTFLSLSRGNIAYESLEMKNINFLDVVAFFDKQNPKNHHIGLYIGETKNEKSLFLGKMKDGEIGFCLLPEIKKYLNSESMDVYKVSKILDITNKEFLVCSNSTSQYSS